MSDLLEQIRPTLQSLRELGARSAELDQQLQSARKRVDGDRTQYENHSRELIPRAQALVAKLGATQTTLESNFQTLTQQVSGFRTDTQALEHSCRQTGDQLLNVVKQLQKEHIRLQKACDEMKSTTQKKAREHAQASQTTLHLVPPKVTHLHDTLHTKVIPAAINHGQDVADHTTRTGAHISGKVVPELGQSSNKLSSTLEETANHMQAGSRQVVTNVEQHTVDLMKQLRDAAQKVHQRSETRLLQLASIIPRDIDAMFELISDLENCMTGLHMARLKAGGVLDTIMSIINDLLDILHQIQEGK